MRDFMGGKQPDFTAGFGPFIAGATLLKHQSFKEECEVRIVASPATQNFFNLLAQEEKEFDESRPLKKILHRQQNDIFIPYIALFDGINEDLPIRRVIIGPSRHQENNHKKAEELLGKRVEVRRSATPFIGI